MRDGAVDVLAGRRRLSLIKWIRGSLLQRAVFDRADRGMKGRCLGSPSFRILRSPRFRYLPRRLLKALISRFVLINVQGMLTFRNLRQQSTSLSIVAPSATMAPAFLPPAVLPSLQRRPRSVPRCCVPQPSPADDFALIDDSSSPIYLQTLLHGGTSTPKPPRASLIPPEPNPSPLPSLLEDDDTATFVDDETSPDVFISRGVELASARSAPRTRRSDRPANMFPMSLGRGRAARVSQDLTGQDNASLRAPNGISDGPQDLMQELLPLLAKEEQEEQREQLEDETDMRVRVDACWDQFASLHRSTTRLDNLRPFRLRDEAEEKCADCKGTGMTTCEYCKGEGFVDLGEKAERFQPEFGDNLLSMPKRVTGNIYHCPLCGGLQEERCVKCFGSGVSPKRKERQEGEAAEVVGDRAWQTFNIDELLRKEADRIEIGLDGTIILRVHKPKRTGRRRRKVTEESKVVAGGGKQMIDVKKPAVKRKRGRPRKTPISEDSITVENVDVAEEDMSQSLATPKGVIVPGGRSVRKSTDFVNTTDYKVGQRLRKQSAQRRARFAAELDRAAAAEQEQNIDGTET